MEVKEMLFSEGIKNPPAHVNRRCSDLKEGDRQTNPTEPTPYYELWCGEWVKIR